MAVDIFLRIDGITGGSKDDQHPGEIDVLGYSWGASNSVSASGRAAGQPSFGDLVVSCPMSQASPELWRGCASGRRLKSAVLTCRRSGPESQEFFRLELGKVIITSYESTASDGEHPLDQVSLAYETITSTFTSFDETGRPESPATAGWDVKKNKKA